MVKNMKLKLPKDVDEYLEKHDLKDKIKKVGTIIIVGATGVVFYKLGCKVTFVSCVNNFASFIEAHPDLKKAYIEAMDESYSK